jgi:DNA-binding transcriptional regulator YhcF (GntR family)/DNA-binding LacI/PurR family transcriptional regulator
MREQRQESGVRVKRSVVTDALRQRVVAGAYAPGARVPAFEALMREFGASRMTVLRGVDQLRREGFLNTRRRSGIFVAPPHLHECAMLFGKQDGRQPDDRYHRVLSAVIQNAGALPGHWRVSAQHNADPDPDSLGYRALIRRVQHGGYAGLIFPHSAHLWNGTPLVDLPEIAKVATTDAYGPQPGISMVRIDKSAFLDRALERAAASGRRRVAVLLPPRILSVKPPEQEHALVMERIFSRGLATEPFWVVQISQRQDTALRRLAHLLLAAPAERRPDAIIVLDDHMTESVTLGVRDSGAVLPRNLLLITYCNFPDRPPAHVPVIRLGFDSRELFRLMIAAIDTQRRTGRVTDTSLQPVFEDELTNTAKPEETQREKTA